MDINTNNLEVVKDKYLLRSHYSFTPLAQKVYALSLAKWNINKESAAKNGVSILSSELLDLGVSEENIYKQLHECSKSLLSGGLIDLYNEKLERFSVFGLYKQADYNKGNLRLFFTDEALDLFNQGNAKMSFLLGELKMLQSRYAIRIYELLISYLKDPHIVADENHRKYIEVDIAEFRLLCGSTSMKNGKEIVRYKNANDLKLNVINEADKQINSYTDVNVRFLMIKEPGKGRSYKKVGFYTSFKDEDDAATFAKQIHDVEDLTPPQEQKIQKPLEATSICYTQLELLLHDMPELKLLQMRHLLEISDEKTIRFLYNFFKKQDNGADIYKKMLSELE